MGRHRVTTKLPHVSQLFSKKDGRLEGGIGDECGDATSLLKRDKNHCLSRQTYEQQWELIAFYRITPLLLSLTCGVSGRRITELASPRVTYSELSANTHYAHVVGLLKKCPSTPLRSGDIPLLVSYPAFANGLAAWRESRCGTRLPAFIVSRGPFPAYSMTRLKRRCLFFPQPPISPYIARSGSKFGI